MEQILGVIKNVACCAHRLASSVQKHQKPHQAAGVGKEEWALCDSN